MGIKEIIEKMKGSRSERKDDLKRRINDIRLQKLAEDRMKGSDERDLETRIEKKRQEMIKAKLNHMREEEKNKAWKSNVIKQKNIFHGHRSILNDNKKLFKMKPTNKGGMYFK